MFDKLRKLFAGPEPPPRRPAPLGADRPQRPPPSRRPPAQSIKAGGVAGKVGAPGGADAGRPPSPLPSPSAAGESGPVEIPCPNCGEPMFAGWGTTCGKCRPHLVAPKTLFLAPGQTGLPPGFTGLSVRPAEAVGMTLGWLVVVRSAEEKRQGALVELDRPTVVLSRVGAPPAGADKLVEFDDGFMSSGHATVRSPAGGDRNGAFTIADRDNPSPSANGTFVNSHKLAPGEVSRLSDGDIIRVGATELLFKSLWLPPVAGRM